MQQQPFELTLAGGAGPKSLDNATGLAAPVLPSATLATGAVLWGL